MLVCLGVCWSSFQEDAQQDRWICDGRLRGSGSELIASDEENSKRTCAWNLPEASGGGERASSGLHPCRVCSWEGSDRGRSGDCWHAQGHGREDCWTEDCRKQKIPWSQKISAELSWCVGDSSMLIPCLFSRHSNLSSIKQCSIRKEELIKMIKTRTASNSLKQNRSNGQRIRLFSQQRSLHPKTRPVVLQLLQRLHHRQHFLLLHRLGGQNSLSLQHRAHFLPQRKQFLLFRSHIYAKPPSKQLYTFQSISRRTPPLQGAAIESKSRYSDAEDSPIYPKSLPRSPTLSFASFSLLKTTAKSAPKSFGPPNTSASFASCRPRRLKRWWEGNTREARRKSRPSDWSQSKRCCTSYPPSATAPPPLRRSWESQKGEIPRNCWGERRKGRGWWCP